MTNYSGLIKDPLKEARQQVRHALGAYDVAEFYAQLHAAEAIETIYQFMSDPNLSVEFRRSCALDLLDRGYGRPTTKAQITLTAPPPDADMAADPVATQIEAAKVRGEQFLELQSYIGQVPYNMWPAHVKELAGEDGAVFAELDATSQRN